MNKVNACDDPEEKYDIIIGREVCQSIGLDMLKISQQPKWPEHVINAMPSGYWKKNRSTFKRQIGTLNEKEIEKKEEQ